MVEIFIAAMTGYINECQHLAKSKNIVLSKIRGIKGSHLGWVIKVNTGKSLCKFDDLFYTLRFYFPYLSLLVQPDNILVY
jgi:hypothetical protein